MTQQVLKPVVYDLLYTQQDIVKQAGITGDQYAQLIFNTGLAFIECFARQYVSQRNTVRENLTLNTEWGFWDWWRVKWAMDDTSLLMELKADKITDLHHYPELKEAMIGEAMLNKELYFIINNKI